MLGLLLLYRLAYCASTVAVAADVACAEASHDWAEVDAVLQVAVNRAEGTGDSLMGVLTTSGQFARACPARRRHWRHLWAGVRALTGHLNVPSWLDQDVRFFCAPRVAHKWRGRKRLAGRLRHYYWRPGRRHHG